MGPAHASRSDLPIFFTSYLLDFPTILALA
jgi:hypothetical protein